MVVHSYKNVNKVTSETRGQSGMFEQYNWFWFWLLARFGFGYPLIKGVPKTDFRGGKMKK